MAKDNEKKEPLTKQPIGRLEASLWTSAQKLPKNIDAAEYKHVVLGLIFLKYISDAFEELYDKLMAGEDEYAGADPEDKDEYKAENVFFVPEKARWGYLQSQAKQPTIGKSVDEAMDAIEKENASLNGVLPKVYARQNLDPTSLGELIDLFGNVALGDTRSRSADILGHVFEYFLGEFALAEGKKGGQFYTPRSVVELLVKMLEPYKGRVFDPCCGSGGMFVQSEKFVTEHSGRINDISIYGQESNQTTWRLAKMNLAIRGIDSSQVKWNNEGSFLNDAHKDLKADYIIANPPFNVGDWSGDLLRKDGRWKYGVPPKGNANYAWIQHFLYHLAPTGQAGFVLAKGALTSKSGGEGDIRKALVEADLIDCIVNLPAKLFLNTQIPASLWFMSRKVNPSQRDGGHYRGGFDYSGLVDRARELRLKQTPAEEIFWQLVRNRQFRSLKFRRQHQIGPYIVDFYCHSERIIIELDGAVHDSNERKKFDSKRDKYLTSLGNKVLRFKNHEIFHNPNEVLSKISNYLSNSESTEHSSPDYPTPKSTEKLPTDHTTPCKTPPPNKSNSPSGETPQPNKGLSPYGETLGPNKRLSPYGRDGREGHILFIDARNLGHLINRRTRVLSEKDIDQITDTYHNWRNPDGAYEDVKGFCASAPKKRVAELDYVVTPGRYVGLAEEEDDFDFVERFTSLKKQFEEQLKEEAELNERIKENLSKIQLPDE